MQFFRLDTVSVGVDPDTWPVSSLRKYGAGFYIPNMLCEVCGRWGGSERIRVELPEDDKILKRLNPNPIPRDDWPSVIGSLSESLGVPCSELRPGAEVGPPTGSLSRIDEGDFIGIEGPQLWIKQHVADALRQHQISGINLVRVHASWDECMASPPEQPPNLWEIVITGRARREDINEEGILACRLCGRMHFPDPGWIKVDESRWDGSDFLYVDGNPNLPLVTQRVCDLLADHGFNGYKCIPVPYVVEGPSWRS